MEINKEYLVNNGITSIEFVFENCETSIIDIDAVENIKIIKDDTGTITYLSCELGLNDKCKYNTFGTNANLSPLGRIHSRADITEIYFHGNKDFLYGNIEWDENDYYSNSYQKSKMYAWNRLYLMIYSNTKIVKEYSYEEIKDILKQVTGRLCDKSSNNVNENLKYLKRWLKGDL